MNILFITVGLIINGVISNIIGNLGKDKKIGYSTAFWVSFLLTPLLGILLVIASVPAEKSIVNDVLNENKPINNYNYRELTPEENVKIEKTFNVVIYVLSALAISFIGYSIFFK